MTDSTIAMSDLRALAEAATPGRWQVTNNRGHAGIRADKWAIVDPQVGPDGFGSGGVYSPDAEYIAAASPDVILALLDGLDGLRAIVNDLAALADRDQGCPICHFYPHRHHEAPTCPVWRAVEYKEGQK